MCVVNVQIDEAVLKNLRPELDTTAAVHRWAQELVDFRIRQMALEDETTMSVEEARDLTLKAVREEYAH